MFVPMFGRIMLRQSHATRLEARETRCVVAAHRRNTAGLHERDKLANSALPSAGFGTQQVILKCGSH